MRLVKGEERGRLDVVRIGLGALSWKGVLVMQILIQTRS